MRCPYCGQEFNVAFSGASNTSPFGGNNAQQPGQQTNLFGGDPFVIGSSGRSRGIAALLAILLGAFGAHYFYLGKTTAGIVFLLISLISCGILGVFVQVAAIVQGILMFTMTDEAFVQKYCNPSNNFPLF